MRSSLLSFRRSCYAAERRPRSGRQDFCRLFRAAAGGGRINLRSFGASPIFVLASAMPIVRTKRSVGPFIAYFRWPFDEYYGLTPAQTAPSIRFSIGFLERVPIYSSVARLAPSNRP